ncbi:phage tail protein [Mergibacter septicus]|uniref:Phage tail protein n=1 Tax=Mergibacter septicus TaxID=221402 RepID=A0A8E3MD54_9PAST|nr:phage tail sheath protein [Mergibacter septicus]AWX15591.1 phage tail protein [Mergibacter septicus]QDJ13066.1 phage tail protein [Mergibacter septicus]QDJ14845.1 phage tail protein [Mergibacter septicus]UTU47727.1 phage tail sheath protein [Mergibacter septicus]WMR96666.1 phage tail sheath protein [Mergibacter septicus]
MSEEYLHGVRVNEITNIVRSLATISTAVIGVVCTANDADATTFPLNKAVLLTNPQAYIAKAGKKGTLSRTLDGIADIVNCKVIVVRVAESTHDETSEADEYKSEMNTNIIGTVDENGAYTGMKALLTASVNFGIKPRILCVPKHDTKEVAVELAALAAKLNAFAYLSCYGCNTKEQAVTYKSNFSQREVMLIFGDFLSFNPNTSKVETDYAVVRACAIRAYQDKEFGWHTSISNKGINGVSGVTKEIYFDINDSSTDVNYLNEKGITCCVNYNGFRFWGLRTCADDPAFKFEVYTRTAQVLKDTIAASFDWAVDKDVSVTLIKDIIEGINAKWRDLTTKGMLMGGKAWLSKELNGKESLQDGKLLIDYDYGPVPPLEQLGFNQRITDQYLVDFADKVAS